jgi:hypothetical protein
MEREVPQSTKIFDRTGSTLLYEIHGEEKRTLVALNEIPDTMKWATIAVEDKTFFLKLTNFDFQLWFGLVAEIRCILVDDRHEIGLRPDGSDVVS